MNSTRLSHCSLAALTAALLCAVSGQALAAGVAGVGGINPHAGILSLRTGDVATQTLPNLLGDNAAKTFPADAVFVVVLSNPMSDAVRASLNQAGVVLKDYLPTNAYIADLSRATPAMVRASGVVASVHTVDPAWKLDPQLKLGARLPGWTDPAFRQASARGEGLLAITLWNGTKPDATLAWLRGQKGVRIGGVEAMSGGCVIRVQSPITLASTIARRGDVQYVEYGADITDRSNQTTRWVVQSNIANMETLYAHGIVGAGSIIGHIDSGMAWDQCALRDAVNPIGPLHRKIAAFNGALTYSAHGTHTAGTLLGDDGTTGNNRGIAWGARVVHSGYPSYTEPAMYGLFDLHRTQGAVIHSNSWGSDAFHTYEAMCRAVDAFQYDNEDNLLVFALSDQLVLGIPDSAKNALLVSASNNAPTQSSMCVLNNGGPATGPTADGRRRPDVVAPGCNISSSTGTTGCSQGINSGTSMACPAVAGVATLMREYFVRGFYPSGTEQAGDAFVPSGALLRAMLVNGAQDLTSAPGYPTDKEGWGRILAEESVYFAGDSRRTIVHDLRNADTLALHTGQVRTYPVQVFSTTSLRATLSFTDAPAAAGASFAPVNDLDLVVTSPTGQVYYGNVFAGGTSVTGGTPDDRNNTEQVHIASPAIGTWTVQVTGTQVNVGTQGFGLVITGGVSPVACDSIDFNNDGLFPDVFDIEEFLTVFSGGPCSTDPIPGCNDIDFNNDGLFPDTADIDALLNVFSGGGC